MVVHACWYTARQGMATTRSRGIRAYLSSLLVIPVYFCLIKSRQVPQANLPTSLMCAAPPITSQPRLTQANPMHTHRKHRRIQKWDPTMMLSFS